MMCAACGAGKVYPSGAPDFTSGFHRGSCWSVICVSFFHVILLSWILIVPFVLLLGIYIFFTLVFHTCGRVNISVDIVDYI